VPEASVPGGSEDQALVPRKFDWLGWGQFLFSTLAALILLGTFLLSSLAALFQNSISPLPPAGETDLSPFLFAAGLGTMGFLMIPSAFHAARRLFGKGSPHQLRWVLLAGFGYLAPLLILMGYGIQKGPDWMGGFLPFIHVLANTAGVFFLLGIVRRKVPAGRAGRFWGAFTGGLGLTPLVTFTLEILILFGIGLVWIALMGVMPDFRQDLLNLASQLQNSTGDSQALQDSLGKFAAQPGVLFTLFGYVALLIPIVEEILKPAAIWFLLRRKLQPWEGFILGATSGAGYALFENLTIGAAADVWTFVTVTRLGTAAVHIFTAGLMGWGLTQAFTRKKFSKLALAFLSAVLLHGGWNGLNILSAVGELPAVREKLGVFLSVLADIAPAGLALIAVGCSWGLIRANKLVRRAIMAGSN
jgi:RsiW-degrading membrane proteinase PrsW (M82 family)